MMKNGRATILPLSASLLFLAVVAIALQRNIFPLQNEKQLGKGSRRRLLSLDSDPRTVTQKVNINAVKQRPIMHTFFTMRTDVKNANTKQHEDLLLAWADIWHAAGWDTKVLTLEDAKIHKDYEKYSKRISTTKNAKEGSYDFMCFMRWLAMSAHGTGGWMSDYDVFPINIDVHAGKHYLPNYGAFTGHQGVVPCLLSGHASEFDRMAEAVLDMAIEHQHNDFYSDMLAMRDISRKEPMSFIQEDNVLSRMYKEGLVDCTKLEQKHRIQAVHLSHRGVDENLKAHFISTKDRSVLIREFLIKEQEQCN